MPWLVLWLACAGATPEGGPEADSGATGGTTTPAAPALVLAGDRPTNLLVISVDTLRRDQVGWHSGLDTTPNLDAILSTGVVLEDHRSCTNWTGVAMLCAMNGRWPLSDDFWPSSVFDDEADPLVPTAPRGLPSLASILAVQHGYATALVTANSVISALNSESYVEGFNRVDVLNGEPGPGIVARSLDALDWLEGTGAPWHLHVHFIDPHGPYTAPAEYNTELAALDPGYELPFDVSGSEGLYDLFATWPDLSEEEAELARAYLFAVYRGEVRYWDDSLGTLWQALDARGALDDTLVIFYSDHGEQFGEHGYFQHARTLYPEENRALAAFWARDLAAGTWSGPTEHQDLAPTALEALGLAADPRHEGAVVGLAPADRARTSFCYLLGYCDPVMSLVKDDLQLIYRWDGRRFFYDLAVDPEATVDLWRDDDPDAQALWALLQPQVQAVVERWPHLAATAAEP